MNKKCYEGDYVPPQEHIGSASMTTIQPFWEAEADFDGLSPDWCALPQLPIQEKRFVPWYDRPWRAIRNIWYHLRSDY